MLDNVKILADVAFVAIPFAHLCGLIALVLNNGRDQLGGAATIWTIAVLRSNRVATKASPCFLARLQLHALAYILANFMRTLALPREVEHWSMTTMREKLIKIGAKIVRHGRYVTFQMAEVAVPSNLFQKILGLIDDLRRRPAPA